MRPRPRVRRLATTAALILLLCVAPAGAHANYEDSDPADGETVAAPPSRVTADFSEPVSEDSYLEVTDPCGAVVSGESSSSLDKITVPMKGDRAGTYEVFFRVQSAMDPHFTQGTFQFTSSGGSVCPGEKPAKQVKSGSGAGNERSRDQKSGGEDSPDAGSGSTGGASTSGPDDSSGTARSGEGKDGGKDKSKRATGRDRNRQDAPLAIRDREPERRGPDPWDLPMDALVTAWVIAALIGAAGGRIYSGILGPRD